MRYQEPELTYLVLYAHKLDVTRACLESIKNRTKFDHKVICLHNGGDFSHPKQFLDEGLIDQLIQTRTNNGLGVGTRDLFAATFSPYSFYLQNDQYLERDFTANDFAEVTGMLGRQFAHPEDGSAWTVMSVDLARGMNGPHIFSERGHIIPTAFYKKMEEEDALGPYGAGPWHNGLWREEKIRQLYKERKYLHYTYPQAYVADNGDTSIRQNRDGSIWEHNVDTEALRLVKGPIKEKGLYPYLSDMEWEEVIRTQSWPEWQIPRGKQL